MVHDTRAVAPGALFCCVPGAHVDGHDLAPDAVGRRRGRAARRAAGRRRRARRCGCRPCATRWGRWRPRSGATRRDALHGASASPARAARRPPPTCSARSSTRTAGRPTVIGTLTGPRTTPEAPELQAHARRPRATPGARAVAMEVSSHALALGRVRGHAVRGRRVHQPVARPPRLPPRPRATTSRPRRALFTPELRRRRGGEPRRPVRRARWPPTPLVPTEGYSLADAERPRGRAAALPLPLARRERVELPLGGRFNVANALGRGHRRRAPRHRPRRRSPPGSRAAPPVPGRFEPVDEGQPFAVLVDYAHKPGALESALGRGPRGGRRGPGARSCSAPAATATPPSARRWARWRPGWPIGYS